MEENKKTQELGTSAGIAIVIIVLLFGAYYFAKQRIEKSREFQETLKEGEVTTVTLSDELSDIETDAKAMNFDGLNLDVENL